MGDLEIRDRLARLRAPVEGGDARAHPLERVEQAGTRRVQADTLEDELRAGQQRGRDDEGRGCREVAGHVDLAEIEPLRALDRDAAAFRRQPRSRRSQHPLGVVARRDALDDRRPSLGEQPREQDARLHLGARHLRLVLDAGERLVPRSGAAAARRSSPPVRPSRRAAPPRGPSGASSASRRRSARSGALPGRRGGREATGRACRRFRSRSAHRARAARRGPGRAPAARRARPPRPRRRATVRRRSWIRCRASGRSRGRSSRRRTPLPRAARGARSTCRRARAAPLASSRPA